MAANPSRLASGAQNISRRNFLLTAGAVTASSFAGCIDNSDTAGDGLSGPVTITGSSTVFPISNAMAEEFQREHANVNVSVDSTGTGGGFSNHFCPGNSDINGASRPIKSSEQESCQSNGVEPLKFTVAGDALTVAVNNENDWVDSMTYDELAQIWGPDGAEKWSDVNSDWPDEEFELYGPASTSGTFDWFTEHVIGEANSHRTDYEATEKDNQLIQGIQGSKYAIGYFGFAYYQENQESLKALKISDGDSEPVSPSLENAKDGSYPMARPLFIYLNKNHLDKTQLQEFMKYYVRNAETDLVAEIGYVPSSKQQRDDNLDKLEQAIEDAT